jgi:hypothetical protein
MLRFRQRRYLSAGILAVAAGVTLLAWLGAYSGRLLAQSPEEAAAQEEPGVPADPQCTLFTNLEQHSARGTEALRSQFSAMESQRFSALSAQTEAVSRALSTPRDLRSGTAVGPWVSRIDYHVFSLLEEKNIAPARLATDAEFLRRVTLDLTGRIPTDLQVQQFEADTDPQKRSKTIDRLLASPEWADRWTMWFGDLLKNSAASTQVNRSAAGRDAFYRYIKSSMEQNKPYNQFVSELITAQGDTFENGPPNFTVGGVMSMGPAQDTYDRQWVQVSTAFLGLKYIDCILCHNGAGHLESINLWASRVTRAQAWGLASFYSRTRLTRGPQLAQGTSYVVGDAATGGYNLNTNSGNRPNRAPDNANGVRTPVMPRYIYSGRSVAATEDFRRVLAQELTADIQFARATVNYLWAHFFGAGIVDPPDAFDLDRLDPRNPPPTPWTVQPSHPELLDELARSFANNGFDLKKLMREIANSQAYQLSSRYEGTWDVSYARYFARHMVRRLHSEELADAIVQSSGVPNNMTIANYPAPLQWTMQLPDTILPGGGVSTFLNAFLRGDRDENPRRGDLAATQALTLMNDNFVISRVRNSTAAAGRFGPLVSSGASNAQVVTTIYLNVLSRQPTAEELAAGLQLFQTGTRATRAQDLVWTLYNKVDFIFNY